MNRSNAQWIILNFTNISKIRFLYMWLFKRLKVISIISEIWNVNAPKVKDKKEEKEKKEGEEKFTMDILYNRYMYFFIKHGINGGWALENISLSGYYAMLKEENEEFKNNFALPYRLAYINILAHSNPKAAYEELNSLKATIEGKPDGWVTVGRTTWAAEVNKIKAKKEAEKCQTLT
jgi:hypothetical protein